MMPLIAKSEIVDGLQKIEIWVDGQRKIVDPPFLPYFLARRQLKLATVPATIEEFMARPLSGKKPVKWYKYTFQNTGYIANINKSFDAARFDASKISRIVAENHTEFRERIILDEPEWFRQFQQTKPIKPLFIDIETATKDGHDLSQILSIGIAGPDRVIKVKQGTEYEMLTWLFDQIQEIDPDLIVGYNHISFDIPFILDRCAEVGINYQYLGRDNKVTYYYEGKEVKLDISGRVLFDIYQQVLGDQTLYGIKNRKMKTVADWMNIPTIIEDTKNTVDIPLDRLKEYNESDVRITMKLFDVYYTNVETMSEVFGVPLNMVVDATSSFVANVFQGQGIHASRIVSDGTNVDRHPEIYNRRREPGDDKGNYEAAYVDIYKTGQIEKVWKVDFKGMYNAIEITLNASPDTTRISEMKPFTGEFSSWKSGQFSYFQIPDKVLNKNVIIEVDNSYDGVLRIQLRKIRAARAEIKKQLKTCSEEDKPKIESQQWAMKVAANIPSGYNGQSSCRWGDISVSILTVGIGRFLIKYVIDYIRKTYGDICIETDTDGIYLSSKVNIDELNSNLSQKVFSMFGTENELELELEEFNQGYFIKMKNYLLYTTNNKLVIHGASLKSSRMPKCFDMSLEKLSRAVLLGEGNIRKVIQDTITIANYGLDALTLSVNLNKTPSQYAKNTLWGNLVSQCQKLNIPIAEGDSIEYIKCKGDYQLAETVNSILEVDQKYYKDMLGRLIINLGLEKDLAMSDTQELSEWY